MSQRRRAVHRRRVQRLTGAAAIALVVTIVVALWLGAQDQKIDAALLCPYKYENEVLAEVEPILYTPNAFASDLAVIPDESIYRDSSINAGAAIIVNATTQEVLYSEKAFQQMSPASTTKLMTMLVVLKYGHMNDTVIVAADAINALAGTGSSVANLRIGDQISMHDLLYALMLPSGNDAANAIAHHVAGGEEGFAELMNRTALEIGANTSHFMNPHGLDEEGHYVTAYDLYLIFNELLQYEEFHTVIGASGYTAAYKNAAGEAVTSSWGTSNGFKNGSYSAPKGVTVLGGKTGTTSKAMFCLTLASQDADGDIYISVVLKAGTRPSLYQNMTNLLKKINN